MEGTIYQLKTKYNRWYEKGVVSALFIVILLAVSISLLILTPEFVNVLSNNVFISNQPIYAKLSPSATPEVISANTENLPLIVADSKIVPPVFQAEGVLAQDYQTGQILFQKNIHEHLAPASTTKVMTTLVALHYYKDNDVLTVPQSAIVGGSTMGLVVGEKVTFKNILYGMLLNSGNDAAYTIAANYPGGIDAFVLQMNRMAEDLNLSDTHFQNPAGFDDPTHYSSAYDLAVISKLAVENSEIAKIVATKYYTVYSADKKVVHHLVNVNQLLGHDGVIGIKTGWTEAAGENLVGLVNKNNHKILTVVLKSTNRFEETKQLIDWIYKDYTWPVNIPILNNSSY